MANSPVKEYDYHHYDEWLRHPDKYFKTLKKTVPFKQGQVKVYGKLCDERRLTSMHVRYPEEGKKYKYSGTTKKVKPFTEEMEKIAKRIKRKFDIEVDMCLCNLYEDGSRNIGWHADDERDMSSVDGGPHIFSISLGATRKFRLRKKTKTKGYHEELILNSGDLLHMQRDCQKIYKHCVPVEKKVTEPRINLTFRVSA
jgi:alkylated DNA repair dioxygenase AlkB